MNFRKWLLNEEKEKRALKIPFDDVKFDTDKKYYVDLNKTRGILGSSVGGVKKMTADDVEIGDLVEDMAMSAAPYWKVHDIDTDANIIYLEPYGKNPFVPNAEGEIIGAGGKKFDQHDFDVMGGKYEQDRIDRILDIINKKQYHDISDIAYILLGTVPVHVGPNGSQGGWYSSGDHNNRGHKKGMDTAQVIAKDASTLKNKLGFDVPESALTGEMPSRLWDQFVGGEVSRWDIEKTKLPIEDFTDAKKMAEIVQGKYPPAIRKRNLEKLLDLGRETNGYDNLIHDLSIKLAGDNVLVDDFDLLWHIKEKIIWFAKQKGWEDVIEAYEEAHDVSNLGDVARHYAENKQLDKLLNMLDKTKPSAAIREILSGLSKIGMGSFEKFSSFMTPDTVQNHFDSHPQDKIEATKLMQKIMPVVQRNMDKIKASIEPHMEIDFKAALRRLEILNDVLLS